MLHTLSIRELSKALSSKKVSSVELTKHFIERSQRLQKTLNAYITLTPDLALKQAALADEALSKGDGNAVCGVPLVHKDIFCTQGVRSTCGSKMLENFISPYDATVVKKTKDALMPMLGKANCDEFAMGSSNENSYFGAVHNPWDTTKVPGGSSGGSAAVVSARMAPLATGSDTGGSIRQPAAFCGITGLKPTYGTVSRFGMVAYASSFDQGGPMARSAEDCAFLYDVIHGFDKRDSTSIDRPRVSTIDNINASLKGKKVGIVSKLFEGVDEEIVKAISRNIEDLKSLGATIVDIDLDSLQLSLPAYYVLAPAEASSNLSRFDGVRYGHRCENPKDLEDLYTRSRTEGFGAEVQRRIMVGTYALSAGYYDAYYLKAQKLRRLVTDDFKKAFAKVDMIHLPTTPNTAFKLNTLQNDPIAMYLQDIFTIPVNLAGLPAIGFPIGFDQGMPIGAQLIGNYFSESTLLATVHQYQQHSEWHRQRTPEVVV